MVLTIIVGMNYIYCRCLCSKWRSNVVFVCFDTYVWLNENHPFMGSWRVTLQRGIMFRKFCSCNTCIQPPVFQGRTNLLQPKDLEIQSFLWKIFVYAPQTAFILHLRFMGEQYRKSVVFHWACNEAWVKLDELEITSGTMSKNFFIWTCCYLIVWNWYTLFWYCKTLHKVRGRKTVSRRSCLKPLSTTAKLIKSHVKCCSLKMCGGNVDLLIC